MLSKIALAVALVLTLSAPAPARVDTGAQAEPAEAHEPAQPTATTPPALQCVRIVYSGNIRTCAEWGPAQPIPTPTPFTGYP